MVHRYGSFIARLAAFAACAFACGCGGGGGGASPASFIVATPAPSPSPTPAPGGAPVPSSTSEAFTLGGQSANVTVSESGYAGAISADASGCANIASVTPASAPAPATFTITAQGGGACSVVFTDGFAQHTSVAVGVTITQGTLQ